MLSRRRHGIRVFGYFLLEVAVVGGSFFVGYAARLRTSGWWEQHLDPLGSYLWLLFPTVLAWAAFLWVPSTYDGFRTRSIAMHAFTAAVSSALSVLALFALLTIFKKYTVNR